MLRVVRAHRPARQTQTKSQAFPLCEAAAAWHGRCSTRNVVIPSRSSPSQPVNEPGQTLPGLRPAGESHAELGQPAIREPQSGHTLLGLHAAGDLPADPRQQATGGPRHHHRDTSGADDPDRAAAGTNERRRLPRIAVAMPVVVIVVGLAAFVMTSNRCVPERTSVAAEPHAGQGSAAPRTVPTLQAAAPAPEPIAAHASVLVAPSPSTSPSVPSSSTAPSTNIKLHGGAPALRARHPALPNPPPAENPQPTTKRTRTGDPMSLRR